MRAFKNVTLVVLVLWLAAPLLAEGYSDLVGQAEQKAMAEDYGSALDLYAKAFETGQGHYIDYYNAACAAALSGNSDLAFTYLDQSVAGGLAATDWLIDDSDLVSLHEDDRWRNLLAAADARRREIESAFPEAHAEELVLDLPAPRLVSDVSVEASLQNRRSLRAYADTPITMADVSQLLWSAYGITMPVEDGPEFLRGGLRTAPSAGALYPLEIYVVARKVTDLPGGIYWYRSEIHKLTCITQDDRWDALAEACLGQPHFETAAAAIVYSAVFERNTSKYGQRGRERYVCMDLGHSAENVYLQAYALGLGTCAIGAFDDLRLKQVIGMTRQEEPLYVMPVGRAE